jgi:hypothetical protein
MANEITNKEQQVQAAVLQGERRYMMDVIGKLVRWGVQMDQIVVEHEVTSIYLQAPTPALSAIHIALLADGDSYMGMNYTAA